VELSRRYLNHVDQTDTLLRTLELVRTRHAPSTGAPVRPESDRTSSPTAGRVEVDPPAVVASYLGGSRLIDVAEEHGVSTSTIKRILRNEGARKYQRPPS
jgi:hypothetical protein